MEAFLGTERGEVTFGERRVPCYSHQQRLLTATLPINSEHLTKRLAVESLDLI